MSRHGGGPVPGWWLLLPLAAGVGVVVSVVVWVCGILGLLP